MYCTELSYPILYYPILSYLTSSNLHFIFICPCPISPPLFSSAPSQLALGRRARWFPSALEPSSPSTRWTMSSSSATYSLRLTEVLKPTQHHSISLISSFISALLFLSTLTKPFLSTWQTHFIVEKWNTSPALYSVLPHSPPLTPSTCTSRLIMCPTTPPFLLHSQLTPPDVPLMLLYRLNL